MSDETTMDAVLAKIRAMPKPPGNVFYLSPESDEEREALRALRERGLVGRRGDVRYPNVLGDRESLYGITEDMPDPEDMDAFREMALGWVEGDERFDDGNLDPDYVEVWWYWWLTADGVAQLWAPFQPKTERRFPLRDEIDSLRADNARLRAELAEARAALAAVLAGFTEQGHPGRPCIRHGWVSVEQVEKWRTALTTMEPPDAPA